MQHQFVFMDQALARLQVVKKKAVVLLQTSVVGPANFVRIHHSGIVVGIPAAVVAVLLVGTSNEG